MTVDDVDGLCLNLDVGVLVLPSRRSIRLSMDLAWMVDCDEEDAYLIAHGPKTLAMRFKRRAASCD